MPGLEVLLVSGLALCSASPQEIKLQPFPLTPTRCSSFPLITCRGLLDQASFLSTSHRSATGQEHKGQRVLSSSCLVTGVKFWAFHNFTRSLVCCQPVG